MFVSRDEDGNLNKVPVPLHYAYLFVAAAAIGLFTITGLAGSYSRMLIKTARFNQLRQDHNSLQKDYAHLEKAAHEKDIQAASLGSLASEVSALYGLTTSKLAVPMNKLTDKHHGKSAGVADSVATAPLAGSTDLTDEAYYKSVDAFYALRSSAMSGTVMRPLSNLGGPGYSTSMDLFGVDAGIGTDAAAYIPTLWPIMGPSPAASVSAKTRFWVTVKVSSTQVSTSPRRTAFPSGLPVTALSRRPRCPAAMAVRWSSTMGMGLRPSTDTCPALRSLQASRWFAAR